MPIVLVVDDEPAIRKLVRRILGDAGFATIEASSGTEAISIVADRKNEIDLVLTDVKMPGMNGFEVGARVAALNAGIAVLYMTGYADPGSDDRARPQDCSAGTVQKPFRSSTLLAAVHRALRFRPHVPAGPRKDLHSHT